MEDGVGMMNSDLELLPALFTFHEAIQAGIPKRYLCAMVSLGC
jgi:hypothetical protein